MRIDTLLCRLRFVKTRGRAQRLIDEGHIRCNGTRVVGRDLSVGAGDVLTLPLGTRVQVVRIDALPDRRGPPGEAQSCYTCLDRAAPLAIAGAKPADLSSHRGEGRKEGTDQK